ncbi:MAG: T9SS type A sorting domain-containing protein [Prevotella sp.]|nr:T9SS type A sorting domain-containing protein [Prevotella sp.]MBR5036227.1 T9SS type A sorting domain-containing protein [Prevotella sp.]MBR5697552.1 T9SS type A sorting domain-containing protein [Prevotella sp.]
MIRNVIKLTLAGLLLTGMPVTAMAASSVEIIENDFQNVTITVEESVIHVTGANGEVLYVYNVAGVRVKSVKIDGDDKRFDFNLPKGCYILKVGKTVRKVSIR